MKRDCILCFVFLLLIHHIVFGLPGQRNLYVDPDVEENVRNGYVRVIIELHNDYYLNESLTERNRLIERDFSLQVNYSGFLKIYSFDLQPAYSAFINSTGLDNLRINSFVKSIYLSNEFSTTLDNSPEVISASNVWGVGYNGSGQVVCVIDSGINYNHSFFGGCNNTLDINDGSCSKVIGGFNFCANEQCTINNTNPIDLRGHGTGISGIVASENFVYRGIAMGSKLVAVKVLNSNGTGSLINETKNT